MRHLPPGTHVAGYRIDGVAGEGGMGVVYRATQLALDRQVALKLITADLAGDQEFRTRFQRESRLAASIEHPHVVPVHEAGEADGRLFISMRLIDGTDLRAIIDGEGALPPGRAVTLLTQVAAALDAAHARGLVHRDIKPGNVLVARDDDGDHAYLTDFGLTKRLGSQSAVTRTGVWVGTLDYMAPEQIMSEHVDARSDVYALGCVLFQMLTGRVPYERDSDVAKLWAHMNEPPPRLSDVTEGLPHELDLVLGRAMAKDAGDRFPSAGDLARSAAAAIEGRRPAEPERSVARGSAAPDATRASRPAPTARRAGVPSTAGRRALVVPLAVGAAAALAVATLVLAVGGAFGGDDGGGSAAADGPPGALSIATIPVDSPAGIAVGDGAVYVSSYERDTVTRLDADTGERGPQVAVGSDPAALALAGGSLFVAQTGESRIARVDLDRGEIVGRPVEPAGSDGDSLEAGEGAVWTAVDYESLLLRVDPEDGTVTGDLRLAESGVAGDIAVGEGGVWVVGASTATVTQVDPASVRPVGDPVEVGTAPEDDEFAGQVALGEGALWATSPEDDAVVRIDPASRRVVARISIPAGLSSGDLAAGLGSVWVADDNGEIVRIDPSTNRAVELTLPAGTVGVNELEVGEDALWVAGDVDRDAVVRIAP